MKFAIQSPCLNGAIDGTVQANLLRHIPNQVPVSNADVVIVPISWFDNFQLNPALYQIKVPVVVIDFLELGLDWDVNSGKDSHILGRNSANFPRTNHPHWMHLDAWVRDVAVVTYFKRELLEREVTEKIVPVDFPCYLPIPGVQTKEEFDARPLEVFHFWGLSHESRPRLHGDIFREAYHNGYEVLSQFGHWHGYFADPRGRTWASVHAPHFDRKPMTDVMHFIHRSKISVSLPGAGVKCFRDSEASCGSIPAFWNCGIARSYPWEAEKNCILLQPGIEWLDLCDVVQQDNLYDLYVAAQETIQKYSAPTYVRDYILPNIERNL
jgi:hypothetical protein